MAERRDPLRERVQRVVEEVLAELGGDLAGARPAAKPAPPAPPAASSRWSLPGIYVREGELRPTPAPGRAPGGKPRVAIGSDHGGLVLKSALCGLLRELGHEFVDVGTHSPDSCDYPDFAVAVGEAVRARRCELGIMVDGAGIGSAMALNKLAGVRAATVHNEATAVNSREHNDANVLVLGSGQVNVGHARRITRIWLATPHAGGRHARRVDKINALDRARSARG